MHLRQFAATLTLIASLGLVGCSIDRRPPQPKSTGPVLPEGNDPFSIEVRRGAAIVNATRDSLPGHVGNRLRCTSCHLDGGSREVLGWKGAYARFPQYRARSGSVQVVEDRVNDCLERSLHGRRLPADTAPMKAIVSYLAWMSREAAPAPGTAGPKLIAGFEELTPDTAAGRLVYGTSCARCHGADGEGTPLATPVWGDGSYNIGAGMARYRSAAAFIQANMPHDLPGTLDRQQAIDVAGFINGHPRPDFAGTRNDWPRGDAPGDTPYRTLTRP
jgi:thiosulfate dehydrogenase